MTRPKSIIEHVAKFHGRLERGEPMQMKLVVVESEATKKKGVGRHLSVSRSWIIVKIRYQSTSPSLPRQCRLIGTQKFVQSGKGRYLQ